MIIPDVCPVLNIPLFRNKGGKNQGPNSPTIDRLDPKQGYTPENIRVISSRANTIKSDAELAELVAVVLYVVREQEKVKTTNLLDPQ